MIIVERLLRGIFSLTLIGLFVAVKVIIASTVQTEEVASAVVGKLSTNAL
jgi:hypothetical protein